MRKITFFIITTFLLPSFLMAGNKNIGTSGATFLKIGAGARPTAMGEAFVGIADDANAVYYNPAGLGYIEKPEITAMRTQWIRDMNYDFGAFVFPTRFGSFGISASTLKVDNIDKRDSSENLLGKFDNLDAAYALSYSRLLHPQFSIGGTARLINQEIDTASAKTFSGDIGTLYKFAEFPMSIGLAARHFGPEIEFQDESDPLPFTVDFGFGLHLFREKLLVGLDLKSPRDNDLQFGVGADWYIPFGKDIGIHARGGYNSAITDADDADGMTFGGGLDWKKFGFDVAWIPFGDLGNTLRYAAKIKF